MKLPFSWPTRYVLPVGFGALLVLLMLATILALTRIDTLNHRLQTIIYEQNIKTGLVSEMLRLTRERSQFIYQLFNIENKAEREAAQAHYAALSSAFARSTGRLEQMELSPEERAMLAQVLQSAKRSSETGAEIVRLLMKPDIGSASELLISNGIAAQDQFQESLYLLLESSRTATMEVVAQASESTRNGLLLIAGVGLLLLAAGGFIALSVIRQVARTENALQLEKELAQVTLHSIGDGVITTDSEGRVEYLNPVAEHYTAWTTAAARGKPLAEIYRVIDERTGLALDALAQKPPDPADAESGVVSVRLVDRNGRECPIRYSHAPIRNREGRTLGMIVVFHDISQIRAMAQQLIWQASHDALTGLVNRREFERRLSGLIETANAQGRDHALMFMDLDNFKAVNDTCGHSAGDELLRQLTTVMLTRMRGSDTLARLGGDEFAGLLESCPLDQALRIANGMRETVREFRFVWENKTFSVGVSIGLVPINATSGNLNRVLTLADACCYDAKNKGRDRVQVHRPQDESSSGRQGDLQVVSQINRAFELGEFLLYRQRIVPLHEGAGHQPSYEVLVRMLDREGNLVPPTGFMPAAERYNLLTSIERWVISSLLEHLYREWKAGTISHHPGDRSYYAVNLSGASINDKSFPDFMRNLLTRYELPPGLLCFEITETTAISNLQKAAELMHELKGMGCRFALDDFGTGMSSFAYLKYLPVDVLKIAGTFVKDMADDPMDYAIVDAINRISHILGMQTVAESVESAEILEKITELKIDFAQGYFIAEPEALGTPAIVPPVQLQLNEV
jgi:diguanylate cyclase (GGDEF)-like protein/PAS domain S-box-containing protein